MSTGNLPPMQRTLLACSLAMGLLAGCETAPPSPQSPVSAMPSVRAPQDQRRQAAAPKVAPPAAAKPLPLLTCKGRGTIVLVDLDARRLSLCQKGVATKSYPIALGVNGIGKRKEGDKLTPIGTYPLGAPYESKEFGPFVPVGYPTAAQVKAGFTGNSVGLHAPHRRDRDRGVQASFADRCVHNVKDLARGLGEDES